MGFLGFISGAFGGKKRSPKNKAVGVPGFAVHGGYLQSSERDQRLVGARMRKTFANNLVSVGIVCAGTRLFVDLASKTLPTMTPDDDSPEAQEWAAMLLRMYARWGEREGFKVETRRTLRDQGRQQIGDVDVALFDEDEGLLAILESGNSN